MIRMFNADSMEAMKAMPDKAYDLAIVDPPYGLDSRLSNGAGKLRDRNFRNLYIGKEWDVKPEKEYFTELFRVSVNQIICGGNYHELPPTREIICWDKMQPWPNFSAWELLWTSFDGPARMVKIDNRKDTKIHPTEKTHKLYEWLLNNYAKPGDKILDTHGGSGSICIACDIMGFDLDWYEIDKEYFDAAKERFERHKRQGVLEL